MDIMLDHSQQKLDKEKLNTLLCELYYSNRVTDEFKDVLINSISLLDKGKDINFVSCNLVPYIQVELLKKSSPELLKLYNLLKNTRNANCNNKLAT